jgi:hypothetical protein
VSSIAPESVRDVEFLEPLKKIMERHGVPFAIITSLFGDAAPTKGGFSTIEQPRAQGVVANGIVQDDRSQGSQSG